MFFRFKRSIQNGVTYEYLQIAESFRQNGKPRQRVLATLGRRDRLEAEGKIDSLARRKQGMVEVKVCSPQNATLARLY